MGMLSEESCPPNLNEGGLLGNTGVHPWHDRLHRLDKLSQQQLHRVCA